MALKSIISFLVITLLLAACGNPMPSAVPTVTESPTLPSISTAPAVATSTSASYPAPVVGSPVPTTAAYPGPGTPGTGTPVIPPSGYEPQPGDENLKRDPVTITLADSKLVVIASKPVQVKASLTGSIPDPCHSLRVTVTPPDANNMIKIDAYSLVDPNTNCVANIEQFTASIPLGSYSSGEYSVLVNGEKLGQFVTTFDPQPGDDKLTRGDVTLDLAAARLNSSGMSPNEVTVALKGSLPDPCHQLRITMTSADAQNKISLQVYSVFDKSKACTTVIQPFQITYPLGSFTSGHYSVYVNDQLVGEFDG